MEKLDKLLAGNIRSAEGGDDSELRESLRRFGWSPKFPALVDERGAVLVGHRRLKLAQELGIVPVIETVHFGEGDAADAERVKLALISNLGAKPMTKADRERIAQHLYGGRQWTMERIAEALGVSARTISTDLRGFEATSKPERPKGGRPKGAKAAEGRSKKPPLNASPGAKRAAELVLDKGRTNAQAGEETGIGSELLVRIAVAREEGRREGRAEPTIDPATLPLSAQKQLEIATRQVQRRLVSEFESVVQERLDEALGDIILSRYDTLKRLYEGVLNRRTHGIIKPAEFRLLASALHPDSRAGLSDERLAQAFQTLQRYKLSLVDEATEPTPSPDFPKTREEWLARRRAATEARRSKRSTGTVRPRA